MNENQQLRFLIRSILQEDATSLVGQHLWPNGRWAQEAGHVPPGPDEPDTEREAELRRKLEKYITNSDTGQLSKQDIEDLVTIASDPRHKKTMSLYKRGKAYRGIQVSKAWFERNFGMTSEELKRKALELGKPKYSNMYPITDKPFTLKSTGVSSWSKDPKMAVDFATLGVVSHGVVFQADSAVNTFIDFMHTYDVVSTPNAAIRSYEKEVLAVGPVKVSAVYLCENWQMNDPDHEVLTRNEKYFHMGRVGYRDDERYIKRSEADAFFDDQKRPDLDF